MKYIYKIIIIKVVLLSEKNWGGKQVMKDCIGELMIKKVGQLLGISYKFK